jgi:hypothetical protein
VRQRTTTRGGAEFGTLALARLLEGERKDLGEANVAAVEAVGLVDVADARVAGLGKGDVDALFVARYSSVTCCVRLL